ncbi:MAG: hypothetical protein DMF03_13930 [Verrucomicrobia bacterium]|nr:MAG: hypothetical protein DMF03_13930 [Verrucomicrobiota bacterium]
MKHRLLRVNELLKRELSGIIAREMTFETGLVSINQVDVTSDLKSAHVFVSVLGASGPGVISGARVIEIMQEIAPLPPRENEA